MDLLLNDFKHTPSEVAELASMSMELISMNHWEVFFDNEADLKSAKEETVEKIRSEKQKSSKLEIDDDMVESDLRDYLYTDKKTIH